MESHSGQSDRRPTRTAPKRVVVVDDSRSIRSWLRALLEQDRRLRVVGEAGCARSARQVIKDTRPDVITLDIDMPGMSGLDFLDRLMRLRPMPVVMISGATRGQSEASVAALSLGAVDCIVKPTSALDPASQRDITRRVFSAACSSVRRRGSATLAGARRSRPSRKADRIILVGASTGGVAALEVMLADMPPDGPPVVVAQHMPGSFLVSFAAKLDQVLPQDVGLARPDEGLDWGQIRLAPGIGRHTLVGRHGGTWRCRFEPPQEGARHCPSVDALFRSAYPWAEDVTAVLLTGLGRDGAAGLLQLREAGAATFGQDRASSVVYGMPRAAWEIGAVERQLPLNRIGAAAARAAGAPRDRGTAP